MERRHRSSAALLLAIVLAACTAPAAKESTPVSCEDPMVQDLATTLLTLDMACDEVAPGTRAAREPIVSSVLGEYRHCFARFQALNAEIREESKAAAEAIRKASQPPESTTCTDFAGRIERLRKLTGR